MVDLLSNPELIRNARAQLRPGRMLTAAGICAALSLTVGYSMYDSRPRYADWAKYYMLIAMGGQIAALSLGGALACLQSVAREKEMNTFDFQRVTRLTPLELAIGKLFGAPILAYFAALCLMPAALFGALMWGARPTFILAAYAMMVLGSMVFHALALMISMLLARGLSTGGALLLMWLIGLGSVPDLGVLELGAISPVVSLGLATQTSWTAPGTAGDATRLMDVFYGMRVHHVAALTVLYLSFLGWFLLALVRNLKRDPSVYELYTPRQSFALALYVNFLVIGFYKWEGNTPLDAQGFLLSINMMMFFALGLMLVHNRDQIRRRVRTLGERAAGWLAASWPAPYVVAGTMVAGAAVIAAVTGSRLMEKVTASGSEWNTGLAVYRVAFVALWIARDTLFLQWMNLTRVRRPLVTGFLYLFVSYSCAMIVVAAVDPGPASMPWASLFMPFGLFGITVKHWTGYANAWLFTLSLQAALCFTFTALQRSKLEELSQPAVHAAD
jgi:hypothetical protein